MLKFLTKLFGTKHEKDVKLLLPIVEEINAHVATYESFTDEQLQAKTTEFKAFLREESAEIEAEIAAVREQLAAPELELDARQTLHAELDRLNKELDQTIESVLREILPEAFAVMKETCRRFLGKTWLAGGSPVTWDMVPYDVQLIGGIVLHQGKIAEMRTGEGKTLVATLPIYLNALPGRGVHIVTVNDYLARRDSEWMAPLFEFHGLTIGCLDTTEPNSPERRAVYRYDITYGTNNEFGFDYLRDNMAQQVSDLVQRGHNYAIVDEVDSVLIDEARTPLIISGPTRQDTGMYAELKPRVDRLVTAQKKMVAEYVAEAERRLSNEDREGAGLAMLRANRGFPKNKRLIKLLGEVGNKRLMQQVENEYLRDNSRRMPEVDEPMYYAIDEKNHSIDLTDKGRETLAAAGEDADMWLLPDVGEAFAIIESDPRLDTAGRQQQKDALAKVYAERGEQIHNVTQILRAYSLYERDQEYIVTADGKVHIVDEHTGRVLAGRRYSDGLHQAIEAKEGVRIQEATQTWATVTLQNYFRMYKKRGGMTGTAETEAGEFYEIYKLDVVSIPTHRPIRRADGQDTVYRSKREKYNAAIDLIDEMRKSGRPTLVGTTSVEVSETLSRLLQRRSVPHNVLNAKQNEREAEIVAGAGQMGAVTIATNMAGRGTDKTRGPGVAEAGGLHILGTERHESRRIDLQLRGRAGRQGDPGSSQFLVSLEDDLMRLFGSDRIARIMDSMGMEEGEVIEHPMVTKSIERAQKRIEEQNFATRKRLLEYDNVMSSQREVIYDRRRHALSGEQLQDDILIILRETLAGIVATHQPNGDLDGLEAEMLRSFMVDIDLDRNTFARMSEDALVDHVYDQAVGFYRRKEEMIGAELMADLERVATLQVIDEKWRDHLREMDDLRESIHLRSFGQKDPLLEYKGEAYRMFIALMDDINRDVLGLVFKAFPRQSAPPPQPRPMPKSVASHPAPARPAPDPMSSPMGAPVVPPPAVGSDDDGAGMDESFDETPAPQQRRPPAPSIVAPRKNRDAKKR